MTQSEEHRRLEREHARLEDKIDRVCHELEGHVHPEIEELAAGMFGSRRSDLEGGDRRHHEGIAYKVDELVKGQEQIQLQLSNGMRVKQTVELSPGQKWITGIVITILSSIAVPLLIWALGSVGT